jgi:hypothetical protein
MHFAQVAFALIAGGAAVLIIAGLVLEALHDTRPPILPSERAPDAVARSGALECPRPSNSDVQEENVNANPATVGRGTRARGDKKRSRTDEQRESARQRRKRRRAKRDEKNSRRAQRESGSPADVKDA